MVSQSMRPKRGEGKVSRNACGQSLPRSPGNRTTIPPTRHLPPVTALLARRDGASHELWLALRPSCSTITTIMNFYHAVDLLGTGLRVSFVDLKLQRSYPTAVEPVAGLFKQVRETMFARTKGKSSSSGAKSPNLPP